MLFAGFGGPDTRRAVRSGNGLRAVRAVRVQDTILLIIVLLLFTVIIIVTIIAIIIMIILIIRVPG